MSSAPPPSYTVFRRISASVLGVVFLVLIGSQIMSHFL